MVGSASSPSASVSTVPSRRSISLSVLSSLRRASANAPSGVTCTSVDCASRSVSPTLTKRAMVGRCASRAANSTIEMPSSVITKAREPSAENCTPRGRKPTLVRCARSLPGSTKLTTVTSWKLDARAPTALALR